MLLNGYLPQEMTKELRRMWIIELMDTDLWDGRLAGFTNVSSRGRGSTVVEKGEGSQHRHKSNSHVITALTQGYSWKQVDTVIELTEQKWMESDVEYGDAVHRLRRHEPLTREYIALLNSRVIRIPEASILPMSSSQTWPNLTRREWRSTL